MTVPNIMFTFSAPRKQYFAFPPDVISRLWKNVTLATTLYKLNQTCKYFWLKRSISLISEYNIGSHAKYYFHEKWLKFHGKDDLLWVTNKIMICGRLINELKNVYHCTLDYLGMCETTITIEEFDLLVSAKTITKFTLTYANIVFKNGSIVPVDVILQKLPNITNFCYQNSKERYHASTLQRMVLLNLLNKIQYFSLDLRCVSQSFDSNYLCFFIQKFAAPSAKFEFRISSKDCYHLQYVTQTFKRNRNTILQRWNNSTKPLIDISSKLIHW